MPINKIKQYIQSTATCVLTFNNYFTGTGKGNYLTESSRDQMVILSTAYCIHSPYIKQGINHSGSGSEFFIFGLRIRIRIQLGFW